MSRTFNRAVAAGIASASMLLALVAPPVALAAQNPSIAYDGARNELTIETADGTTDLLQSFKGVVPGDVIEQDINVSMTGIDGETRMYVRAEVDDDVAEDLRDVTLSAEIGEVSESARGGAAFAEQVMILDTSSNVTDVMHVRLTVPETVGNEIAGVRDDIKWIITVEEEDGGGDSVDVGGDDDEKPSDNGTVGEGSDGQQQDSDDDDKFLGIIDTDDLQQTGTAIAAIAGGVLIMDVIAVTLILLAKRRNGHGAE